MKQAWLILEDGTIVQGTHHGDDREVYAEVVFNTSMTGYQEIMTDPSYQGQAVMLTYPLIGNYGINDDFSESEYPHLSALITHEIADYPSHFASAQDLDAFLKKYHIFALTDVDTRSLTRKIREKGTMEGYLTCDLKPFDQYVFPLARDENFVAQVTAREIRHYPGHTYRVALYDFGMKANILRHFLRLGYDVTVLPAATPAAAVLAGNFDGVVLSNGPGDPKTYVDIINEMKILYASKLPILAICLGHQLMALANGFDTYRLKYGHRGANHPVKDLRTGRVYLSSQNHGYVVDDKTIDENICAPLFVNVNDQTNEGLIYKQRPIISTQFHPEACPGPADTEYLFSEFFLMMEEYRHAERSAH